MISINVNNPKNRQIFVSRMYATPAGTTPTTLTLPPGTYTVETVQNGAVDFRGRVVDVPDDTEVDLDLQAVVPPSPIPGLAQTGSATGGGKP